MQRISSSPRIRGRSVSVVELIFHTATVIVMGCAASVEPKAALPPVQRYNFVGPEIGRSSSMLDSAESREICPFGCRNLKLNVDVGREHSKSFDHFLNIDPRICHHCHGSVVVIGSALMSLSKRSRSAPNPKP